MGLPLTCRLALYHVLPAEEGSRAAESFQPGEMPGAAGSQPVLLGMLPKTSV